MNPSASTPPDRRGGDVGSGVGPVDHSVVDASAADSFDDWVRPHLAVLAAVATREVGRAHTDDVVQETLLRAWQRRATYRSDRGSSRAWLMAILYDQARRYRIRVLHRLSPPSDLEAASASFPAGPADASEQRLAVEAAVRRLPRRQRQAVTLFYLADLPIAEIGVLMGVRETTVRVHLNAARTALRKELTP